MPAVAQAPRRVSNGLAQSSGVLGAVARFWQRSYASDYVGLAILVTGWILILIFVEPFHRMFFLDNLAISYPYAAIERVSVTWLFIYTLLTPLVLLTLWAFLLRPAPHITHVTFLGYTSSMILTPFLTDTIKNAVGRPRPDLLARCVPAPGTPAHELVTYKVCTQKSHHTLHDGWRSFPSGHSSFAFAGLGYLSLFIAGQLRVYRPRADLARVLVALAPLLGAVLIAISRCEDYRHDVWDVSAGAALGMGVAWFTYRRYYPGLRSRGCNTPYPGPGEEVRRSGKVDEEALRGLEEFELSDLEAEEEEGGESRPLNGRR